MPSYVQIGEEGPLPRSAPRGAGSYATVDHDFVAALERAEVESRTHVEQMALDMGALMRTVFPQLSGEVDRLDGLPFLARMRVAAQILLGTLGPEEVVRQTIRSASDTVRGWGAFAVGQINGLPFDDRMDLVKPFADDSHFAVREWAWLATRPAVIAETEQAVAAMTTWAVDSSPRIRRFASEVTRPRGVWSRHLPSLKASPWSARPILDPLAADDSRYVRDSVGNWLNDASKSQPEWVLQVCMEWEIENPGGTAYVRRRALRSASVESVRL